MEGEAAAAAVQFLVQNLIDLSKKEISQIRHLHKDAAKLADNLDMIKNYLNDAETRDITSKAVKSWLEKLENVAFDADNVLDELNYHILSKQIKPTEPKKAKGLVLYNCKKLRRLPSMDAMQRLTTLKKLKICDCPELVIKSEAADSEWPKVSHIPSITIDDHTVFEVSLKK